MQAYQDKNGYMPSQQEIAKHFGFKSLGTIRNYFIRLEQQGHLNRKWNAKRATQITSPSDQLPLLGRVAAGRPIESIESNRTVEVPKDFRASSGEHFVLEVKGDSMIEDGILDGDYVVIRKQPTAEKGQTVVALIENEATIKRYHPQKDQIYLMPANENYKPIIVENFQSFKIEGVLTGVLRKMLS